MNKAYTTFIINQEHPVTGKHITHHYFGDVTDEEILFIRKLIRQDFLETQRFQTFVTRFHYESAFGQNGEIRVVELLRKSDSMDDLSTLSRNQFRYPLRQSFEAAISAGAHPIYKYRPHLTGDSHPGEVLLVKGFALVINDRVELVAGENGVHDGKMF